MQCIRVESTRLTYLVSAVLSAPYESAARTDIDFPYKLQYEELYIPAAQNAPLPLCQQATLTVTCLYVHDLPSSFLSLSDRSVNLSRSSDDNM